MQEWGVESWESENWKNSNDVRKENKVHTRHFGWPGEV
jgi:hypothetical protein